MGRFDLTDEEWAVIEPLLPPQGRGPERKDDRQVLNGIFSTSFAPALLGATCLNAMALERRSTIATTDGASGASGRASSRRWRRNARTRWSSSMLPS